MENSPPGIQTMPGWALPVGGVLLGTVGAKSAFAVVPIVVDSAGAFTTGSTRCDETPAAEVGEVEENFQRVTPAIVKISTVISIHGCSLRLLE